MVSAEEVRAEAAAWFGENWDPDLTLGAWWDRLAESGWGFPSWPRDWYGRGLARELAGAVAEARHTAGAFGPPSGIGVMMAGPTLVDHATDEQRRRLLPAMVSGREVWCQLFSEPGAGSDLAGLATRAERDADEWVVTGQKVWTSGAQFSRWGILIARTNVDAPKHRGITYFVIDMDQPGVQVRPLKEMTGGATFNEVFLTEARVPAENVIGEVDGGWAVAVTTLAHERTSLGAGGMTGGGGTMIGKPDLAARAGDLVGRASRGGGLSGALGGGSVKLLPALLGRQGDPIARQDAARIYTLTEIARFTTLRAQAARATGGPGPAASLGKLLASRLVGLIRDSGLRMAGAGGLLAGPQAPLGGMLSSIALFSPAVSIAGGSDQVQRNIVGERVLGLPVEPRTDKEVPYRELRVGTQR